MADDGSRNFPNAQYYISQADYDFWTTEKSGAHFKVFWEAADQRQSRRAFWASGAPGIRTSVTPGWCWARQTLMGKARTLAWQLELMRSGAMCACRCLAGAPLSHASGSPGYRALIVIDSEGLVVEAESDGSGCQLASPSCCRAAKRVLRSSPEGFLNRRRRSGDLIRRFQLRIS